MGNNKYVKFFSYFYNIIIWLTTTSTQVKDFIFFPYPNDNQKFWI